MLIASLTDLQPIDYRAAFPQTSFSASGPSDEFLADMGYAKVNVFRPHDRRIEKLVPCEPVLEDGWVYTVAVEPKTQEELDADTAGQAALVRAERNAMLSTCDWTQVDDTPMTNVKKQEWAIYRQALRDISKQEGFPWELTWPTSPNNSQQTSSIEP